MGNLGNRDNNRGTPPRASGGAFGAYIRHNREANASSALGTWTAFGPPGVAARVPQLDGDDKPFPDASIPRVHVSAWSPELLTITLWRRRDASTVNLVGPFGKKQTEGFAGHPPATCCISKANLRRVAQNTE